jgi:hypothetical protein
MNKNFNKLAVATGVALALGGTAMTSQAAMLGIAGEALLVPLVVWGDSDPVADVYVPGTTTLTRAARGDVNTLVQVIVPSTIGFDTIPNVFTAPSTTPTNPDPSMFPPDIDLEPRVAADGRILSYAQIHWHWYDYRSAKKKNDTVKVTPDDMVELDWQRLAQGQWRNQPGYMVITTRTSSARPQSGADFAMFGSAVLQWTPRGLFPIWGTIPVLAMSDGPDGLNTTAPEVQDQVKYGKPPQQYPVAVSPLITGMRTNRSDGDLADFTVFDLSLSPRTLPTVHVVWLDKNLGENSAGANPVPVHVFDSDEKWCSDTIPLPHELNVVYIPPAFDTANAQRPAWTSAYGSVTGLDVPAPRMPFAPLCVPSRSAERNIGFVNYQGIKEYIDTNKDAPESAGVTFSVEFGRVPELFKIQLGHERGTYKN